MDFDYAYEQVKIDEETETSAVTGGNFTEDYRFFEGVQGVADKPTIVQKKVGTTNEFKQSA